MVKEERKKIDEIDKAISKLLKERMDIAYEIGLRKKAGFEEIYAPDREREVLMNVAVNSGNRTKEVAEVYKKIFEVSRRLQEELFRDKS